MDANFLYQTNSQKLFVQSAYTNAIQFVAVFTHKSTQKAVSI